MNKRYDIAIVGSGPAGISAALNASIRKKSFVLFGSRDISNKLLKAHTVNNYLGLYGKSGKEIKEEFSKHLDSMNITITEEKINNIYSMGDYFSLIGNNNVNYESTTVILACGVNYGKLLKGEEEFLGKGVGYCATCDAPLYKDKKVAIISYSRDEEGEANYIKSIASKVYYIPMYKEEVKVDSDIEIIRDTPTEIKGDFKVNKLCFKDKELEVDGVFVLRESISPGQLVPGINIEDNHVSVDRLMKTNLKGCFAAGDIVGAPYQYIKAAGEGNIAALSAVKYIENLKNI